MLEVKNLSAWYGGNSVFENLNFQLRGGTFTALCGKNGSGKSTLLSLFAGIVPAGLQISGDILLDGKSVFSFPRKKIVRRISFFVQKENPVWNFSVREFVETGLYSFAELSLDARRVRVDRALSELNIFDLAEKKIFCISGGEFQKCRLARCLVQQNDILLFDEPVANLDLPFQIQFLKILKNLAAKNSGGGNSRTVLFSIHDINAAGLYADDFLIFSEKNIVQGTVPSIFSSDVLSKAFGSPAHVFFHPECSRPQVFFE